MTKRSFITALVLVCLTVCCWTSDACAKPTSSPQKRQPVTQPSRAPVNVVCQPLFVCDIVMDPGETILSMATGDSVRWLLSTVVSGPNAETPHVLVKPTDYALRTNLIIATNKRVCYMILVSTRRDFQNRARFYYPIAEVAHITQDGESGSNGSQVDLARLDYAYRIHGEHSFIPAHVMNDGAHTYIQMPPGIQDMPVVFVTANDGSDAIVNYRFRHGMFIVDCVPERLVLVQGSGHSQRRVIIERGN